MTQVRMVDKKTQKFTSVKKPICYQCGQNHLAPSCILKDSVCNKKEHLVTCCRNAEKRQSKSSRDIHEVEENPFLKCLRYP